MSKFELTVKPSIFTESGNLSHAIQFSYAKKGGFNALTFARNQTSIPNLPAERIYSPDQSFYHLDLYVDEQTASDSMRFEDAWQFRVWASEEVLNGLTTYFVEQVKNDITGEVTQVKIKARIEQGTLLKAWAASGYPEFWVTLE